MAKKGKVPVLKGLNPRVLRVKQGYNPNSSSIAVELKILLNGTIITGMLLNTLVPAILAGLKKRGKFKNAGKK